jgi:hypothetical protein
LGTDLYDVGFDCGGILLYAADLLAPEPVLRGISIFFPLNSDIHLQW